MDEVMITGIGSHTSIGRDTSELWESLLAGKCGTEPLTLFDVSSHTNKMACQIHHLPAPEQQGLLDGGEEPLAFLCQPLRKLYVQQA